MGVKVVQITLGLAVLEAIIGFLCLFMHFFKQTFNIGGLLPALQLEVYLMRAYVNVEDSDMCAILDRIAQVPFCNQVRKTSDIQEIQQRFCAQAIRGLLPDVCDGLTYAYILGIMIVMLFFISLILSAASNYLREQYINGHPKKKYRRVAMFLDVIRLLFMVLVILLYYPLVLLTLSDIQARGALNAILSASSGWGTGRGYIMLWMVPILQLAIVILANFVKVREEITDEDRREEKRFQDEMELTSTQQWSQNQSQNQSQGMGGHMGQGMGSQGMGGQGMVNGHMGQTLQSQDFGAGVRQSQQSVGQWGGGQVLQQQAPGWQAAAPTPIVMQVVQEDFGMGGGGGGGGMWQQPQPAGGQFGQQAQGWGGAQAQPQMNGTWSQQQGQQNFGQPAQFGGGGGGFGLR